MKPITLVPVRGQTYGSPAAEQAMRNILNRFGAVAAAPTTGLRFLPAQ